MAPAKRKAAKKKKGPAAAADGPARFEEALQKLEAAVDRLESGELGMDDALEKYEEGITQLRHCQQILKRAEQRVEELLRDAGGELSTSPLPVDADDDADDDA